jgi:hypothetical protein
MSTNSTMINDRYCWNCGLAEHDCDNPTKEDFHGYCINWTPTKTDSDNNENFQLEESLT